MNNQILLEEAKKKVNTLLLKYAEYRRLSTEIENASLDVKGRLEQERVEISDAMYFSDPIVWMMYKHRAYQGTDNALNTMGDLRFHVAPEDDICHQRFDFLNAALVQRGIHLENKTKYPDSLSLGAIYQNPQFVEVVQDETLQKEWAKHEYFNKEGKVAKWQNYAKEK